MIAAPLLSVRNLSKSFPGQRALDSVDLDVHAGEVVAVVGQNGSGKSTLVKLLTGIHVMDPGGEVIVRNADDSFTDRSAQAEIHVIHQDLGLIGTLSTVENLGLNDDRAHGFAITHKGAERDRAEKLTRRFGVEFDVTCPVDSLTPGERTIVALARALAGWTSPNQVLLLDEPTAALHGSEADKLFTAIRSVAAAGAAVVFISHRLDEVLDVADRVIALRGGRVVADVAKSTLDRPRLIELIAGRAVSESVDRRESDEREPGLTVRGLSGMGIKSLDFEVRQGQIVGVSGILGSGREHLASLVFGAERRDEGDVLVVGNVVAGTSPRAAISAGIGFVPSDRRGLGAVMEMRARENLTLPGLRSLRGRAGKINARAERIDALKWCREVELDPPEPERPLDLFSGGNQQKVVLAKWLRNRPHVLLLDEPTQGVDVGAKAAIYSLISKAAAAGAAVVVSSSDTAELAVLCDRVIVLQEGRITADLTRAEATEHRLVAESLAPTPDHHPDTQPETRA